MMGERRQKIFESDEYIQQDNGDLDYLEERYSSLKIPYVIRRVVDDYIACLESRDERYADYIRWDYSLFLCISARLFRRAFYNVCKRKSELV